MKQRNEKIKCNRCNSAISIYRKLHFALSKIALAALKIALAVSVDKSALQGNKNILVQPQVQPLHSFFKCNSKKSCTKLYNTL